MAVLGGILVLGFFAVVAFAFIGGIVALTRALTRPHAGSQATPNAPADPRVIEGEYAVINDTRVVRH